MFSDSMTTFAIKNDGLLKGNKNKGKRTAIKDILFNLLQKAGYNPDQFEANIFHDARPDTAIASGGCKFKRIEGRNLTVSIAARGEYFVAKLNSKTCDPEKLNQTIREALGTSAKDEFLFVYSPVNEKEKPKASDIKPKPQLPTPQPQSQPSTPKVLIMQTNKTVPDLKQSVLTDVNLRVAHVAIYNEVGNHKDHPFDRAEAQDWMNSHGLTINHYVVTGRIMGSLVRRGLYIRNDEEKTWSMTPLGVKVASKQEALPADETPKKERKKRGSSKSAEPDEGKAKDDDEKPQATSVLENVLAVAGVHADCVKDLVAISDHLRKIEAERLPLLDKKAELIAHLEGNSAGVIVAFLRQTNIID